MSKCQMKSSRHVVTKAQRYTAQVKLMLKPPSGGGGGSAIPLLTESSVRCVVTVRDGSFNSRDYVTDWLVAIFLAELTPFIFETAQLGQTGERRL